jgi:transposase
MLYCGIDLGKKSSRFCVVDDNRKVQEQGWVKMRDDSLVERFGQMAPMKIVVEASSRTFWVGDLLEEMGHDVFVVDPGRTKAIGASRIKHDKLDARVLAELCQAGLLATVDRPSKAERLQRVSITARDVLVRARTKLINAAKSMLENEGYQVASTSSDRTVRALDEALEKAPEELANSVSLLVEEIEHMSEAIGVCDEGLKQMSQENKTMKMLQTLDGVGPLTAAVYVLVIRNPERFSSGRQVGAYLGLVPSLYSSGQTHVLGRITRRGNSQLRFLLTMAAGSLLRSRRDSPLKRWALELAERVGRKKARVALARKIANVMWSMWKHERPFELRWAETH